MEACKTWKLVKPDVNGRESKDSGSGQVLKQPQGLQAPDDVSKLSITHLKDPSKDMFNGFLAWGAALNLKLNYSSHSDVKEIIPTSAALRLSISI